jgi:hypothetical protein
MPICNEKKTFNEVIESLCARSIPGFEIEICLIENNSADGRVAMPCCMSNIHGSVFPAYKILWRDCLNKVRFQQIEIGVRYASRLFDEGKRMCAFANPPTWIKADFRHRFSNLYDWPKYC